MMAPGKLDSRAKFQSPVRTKTDLGGRQAGWKDEMKVWAGVRHLRGGEAVMQARMASRNPAIVTVRNTAQARGITSEWQVELRDRTGIRKTYAVKEDPRPVEGGAFLEMLVEG